MTTSLNFAKPATPNQMDLILAELETERETAAAAANTGRSELVEKMLKANVTSVDITFSGSGDSGCIEEIAVRYAGEKPDDLYKRVDTPEQEALRKEIEDWADTYLEGTGVDWYNNDGGQGEIEFDLTSVPLKFSAYVDQNTTTSSREFSTDEVA